MSSEGAAEPRFLKTAEVATLLRTTPSAVSMMRHRGVGPPGFRCGRYVLYPQAEVEEWLAMKLAADRLAQRAAVRSATGRGNRSTG
ncbi:helix-turn-helix transcriptional regulator [Streptomyces hydrogenans]